MTPEEQAARVSLAQLQTDRLRAPGGGIACRRCGCTHWYVTHTEPLEGAIRRRRTCRHCGWKITTTEKT